MNGDATILLILGDFIFIVIALTIFWRIAIALDQVAKSLQEISQELKKPKSAPPSNDQA
jgi:hypothetical protein